MTNNGGNDTIAAVTAMGYDAYYVALEALKAAGSTDPAAVKAALPNVTYEGVSGPSPSTRSATPSATPPISRRPTPPTAPGTLETVQTVE